MFQTFEKTNQNRVLRIGVLGDSYLLPSTKKHSFLHFSPPNIKKDIQIDGCNEVSLLETYKI